MPPPHPSHRWRRRLLTLAASALAMLAAHAGAQELVVLGGLHTNPPVPGEDDRSDAYAYVYQQNFAEHWYGTYTYLNEGHLGAHHRDGHSFQLWWRYLMLDRRLALSLGAGPYLSFDTTNPQPDGGHVNQHGVSMLASAAATWYVGGAWLLQARFNRTVFASSFQSNTLLLGVGYQLDRGDRPGPFLAPPTAYEAIAPNELDVMLGGSIINSFEHDTALAGAVEYRRRLWRYVDGTVTYLDEGSSDVLRRAGVATQAWITGTFLRNHLTLGVGLGPYYATSLINRGPDPDPSPSRWAGLLTLSASYRFNDHWAARLSWYRAMTGYNRDADVFLTGVGYRF